MEQPTGHRLVEARDAITRAVAGGAGKVFRFIEVNEAADEQVQTPIIVVIKPYRARRPPWSGHACFFRHIRESAVTVVVVKNASAVLRDVDVGKAIAIVVANSPSLAISAGGDSGFFGYIREGSIMIIPV